MKSFKEMGVRQKFQILLGVNFLLIGLFVLYYFPHMQKNDGNEALEQQAKMIEQLISTNFAKGLISNDASSVQTELNDFEKMKDVEFAVVLKKDGSKFSAYNEDKYEKYSSKIEEMKENQTDIFVDDNLILEQKSIVSNEENVGFIVIGMSKATVASKVASARIISIIIGLIILIISVSSMQYLFTKMVFNPIGKVLEMAKEMQKGHVKARTGINTNDEIGTMAKVLDQFVSQVDSSIVGAMKRIAEGDISFQAPLYDEKDEIAPVINKMTSAIREMINESKLLVDAAKEGKLSIRGNANKFSGGYKEIIQGLNDTLDAIIDPIEQQRIVLEKMSEGDLTARMVGDYKGDFAKVKESINNLANSFSYALADVSSAVKATSTSSNQISSSAEEMAAGAQEQSSQTSEVATAIEQMTRTILETTKNAGTASENAKKAGKIAEEGGKVVENTVEGIKRISEVVSRTAETVKQLGKSSNQIGEIIQVINDIADQTNLLALNAAIEAARAGEQGRGFSVVADEVRKLAERTTKATKEIAGMIKQIQHDTKDAVESIESGTVEVEKGKEMANKAGDSLREIISATNKVVDDINQVASASEEQSTTAEQISRSIDSMSNVSNESASGIQLIAKSAEDLNNMTENLHQLIKRFNIITEENEQEIHYAIRKNGKLIKS
jgi:methyl-accepting chemotaxis protein